jgi:excisionase family DNA binding protein
VLVLVQLDHVEGVGSPMPVNSTERLLTLDQVAVRLNVKPRFARRLVDERRIGFVHVGRFVRIPESAVAEFIAAGLVEPRRRPSSSRKAA